MAEKTRYSDAELEEFRAIIMEKPELVIIDEAHHAQARTYRMLWSKFPEAKFLGLTATPCRMGRTGFTDLFDSLVCSWSVAEFIRKGWLSSFDYVSIRANSREPLPSAERIRSMLAAVCCHCFFSFS